MKSLATAFAIFLLSASSAMAACGAFPQSNFLGNYSHDQIAAYVDRAHGGDWTPYISMLERNLDALRDRSRSSGSAVLKVRGEPVELSSRELNRFVYVSAQFNEVVKCLAKADSAASLNDFETAAGSADLLLGGIASAKAPAGVMRTVGLASVTGNYGESQVSVQIIPECTNGDSVFRVVNTGAAWPDTGMFTLFRIDGPNRQMIGARRLTLGVNDTREFTISKSQNRTGHVGISIDPSWYDRSFEIDADARCE